MTRSKKSFKREQEVGMEVEKRRALKAVPGMCCVTIIMLECDHRIMVSREVLIERGTSEYWKG